MPFCWFCHDAAQSYCAKHRSEVSVIIIVVDKYMYVMTTFCRQGMLLQVYSNPFWDFTHLMQSLFKIEISLFINRDICISR